MRSLLVLITGGSGAGDRRRGIEALRIAAGVAAWRNVRLTVVIHGPDPSGEGEAGDPEAERYREILGESAKILHAGGAEGSALSDAELAALCAEHDGVARF